MEAAGEQFSVSQREQTKHLTVLENSQDIKVDTHIRIQTHTHTYKQTHTHTHTYKQTHTHTYNEGKVTSLCVLVD